MTIINAILSDFFVKLVLMGCGFGIILVLIEVQKRRWDKQLRKKAQETQILLNALKEDVFKR